MARIFEGSFGSLTARRRPSTKRFLRHPYKGFINPRLTPVRDKQGDITDITISYDDSYDQQMLRYGNSEKGRNT